MHGLEQAVSFQSETFSDTLWSDLLPLMGDNYAEAEGVGTQCFKPRKEAFEALAAQDALVVVTARSAPCVPVGYLVAIIYHDLHSQHLVAVSDALYVAPDLRAQGIAEGLIKAAEARLAIYRVGVFHVHTRTVHPARFLERQGYAHSETVHSKRLKVA